MAVVPNVPTSFANLYKHRDQSFLLRFEGGTQEVRVRHDPYADLYNMETPVGDMRLSWEEVCDFTKGMLSGRSTGLCNVNMVADDDVFDAPKATLAYVVADEVKNVALQRLLGSVCARTAIRCDADAAATECARSIATDAQRAVCVSWTHARECAISVRPRMHGPTFRVVFFVRNSEWTWTGVTAKGPHPTLYRGPTFIVPLNKEEKEVTLYDFARFVSPGDDALDDAVRNVKTAGDARDAARMLADVVFSDVYRIGRITFPNDGTNTYVVS